MRSVSEANIDELPTPQIAQSSSEALHAEANNGYGQGSLASHLLGILEHVKPTLAALPISTFLDTMGAHLWATLRSWVRALERVGVLNSSERIDGGWAEPPESPERGSFAISLATLVLGRT